MIKRYHADVIGEYRDGSIVLYTDHAAEMKEVLEAGRMLYLHGDSEKRGEWVAVLDKYRHYLEEK